MMKNSQLSYERNNGLVRLHDLEGLKILNEDLKVLYDIERIAPAISRARKKKKTMIKNCTYAW